ncbi:MULTISPECIES: ABC transporter ATP-binding protein [unclassified Paenibacillus]|uniref:ABC transporter ATP-binding protein n=1 Tax=unclassified Paenibacillus TaxID=185978 RepID=UPI000CFD7B8E|nr:MULTISPECIES: ABC transporter ATP-binding protein [unclassified Paenibacillus]PRA08587.1 sodium ABC transporter ATP-binding protein [Paenibacillus sp. MYb63]PRA48520.1 sodium ABC transporter ATP-binding protein [Paenibacillus sp. MYb67]QZN78429.1 ABC transporter ATP-binding protein [Paenibacillus sp. DR312]
MNAIELRNVTKTYPLFKVDNVSLDVKKGYITGLIGPNGAGKSTLIKMITGLIQPDKGSLKTLGSEMPNQEVDIKQRLGIVSDECFYYEHLTIREMTQMIAPFYTKWDNKAFNDYLDQFELSPKKKIQDLSKGMKIKYSLAVALSHEADLLIMDEPTSGLDPVFRRELLDLLADMIQDETRSIIFSTHITTDLERIADYITFIHQGKLVFNEAKDDVLERYTIVKGDMDLLDSDIRKHFIGIRETAVGFEALSDHKAEAERLFGSLALLQRPTLEDLIYFTAKGGRKYA